MRQCSAKYLLWGDRLNSLENLNAWLVTNLERALESRGWRQADLSRATGLAPTSIGAIVKGHSWPGPDTLAKIADALGLKSVDLLRQPEGNIAVKKPPKLAALEFIATLDDTKAGLLELFTIIPTLDDVEAERLLSSAKKILAARVLSTPSNVDTLKQIPKIKRSK